MFRALWFLIKASLLVGAVIWLAQRPGEVDVVWQGYRIETSVGFVAALLAALLIVWTLIYRFWRSIVSVPAAFRRYRISARRENGYRTVTRGLVAVAAGDAQAADRHARRAEAMIPGTPLTRLLTAQAAGMNGNLPKARREFATLLEDDSAAFFGVRGLLNETLAQGDYAEALQLMRRAESLQPKRLWVIRTLLDLETRNREWTKALVTLKKAERLGIFDVSESRSSRQAILTALSDDALHQGQLTPAIRYADYALSLDYAFMPAAVRLVRLYEQAGRRRAALKTVLKSWSASPHPDLAEMWARFMPPPKKSKSAYDEGRDAYLWMKQLFDLRPEHRESYRALGMAALRARMWREARDNLVKGMDYRALARLEREETGNDAKAREWLEIAADSPPDPKWVCHACGHVALDWAALCRHCGVFNAQEWMTPSLDVHAPPKKVAGFDNGVIGPPVSQG